MEYLVDDAREQSFTRFAIFEEDSKTVNDDFNQDDIKDRCGMAGGDLTKLAEAVAR